MSKNKKGDITIVVLGIVALIGCVSAILWKKDGKRYEDNPVEEVAEEIIKLKTGVDVDLTPGSKEKPKKQK